MTDDQRMEQIFERVADLSERARALLVRRLREETARLLAESEQKVLMARLGVH